MNIPPKIEFEIGPNLARVLEQITSSLTLITWVAIAAGTMCLLAAIIKLWS